MGCTTVYLNRTAVVLVRGLANPPLYPVHGWEVTSLGSVGSSLGPVGSVGSESKHGDMHYIVDGCEILQQLVTIGNNETL